MPRDRYGTLIAEQFGLPTLAEVSGVPATTILKWQHRGAIHFEPIGRGKVRSYTMLDAIHLAIIAEMRRIGLTITGEGADFSRCLLGYAKYHLTRKPTLEGMRPMALQGLEDGMFGFFHAPAPEARSDSYAVIGVRRVVERVFANHEATQSRCVPAQPRRARTAGRRRVVKNAA